MSDRIEVSKLQKKNLLVRLMQYQFEENMVDILKSTNFSSMEELDALVTEKLAAYLGEVEAVKEYYKDDGETDS